MIEYSWVLVSYGENPQAQLCSPTEYDDPRKSVHDFMCLCGELDWWDCKTEDIPETIRMMDEDDNWRFSQDGSRFSITWEMGEIDTVTLYRLSKEVI